MSIINNKFWSLVRKFSSTMYVPRLESDSDDPISLPKVMLCSPSASIGVAAWLFASSATADGFLGAVNTEPNAIFSETTQTERIENIDPWTGNLNIRHKDLELAGNGGLDIKVWRTYDMAAASGKLTSTHNQSYRWAALGPGWTLSAAPKISVHSRFGMVTPLFPTPPYVQYYKSALLQVCSGDALNTFEPTQLILDLPDGGSERLYRAGSFRALTKSGWKLDCIKNKVTLNDPQGIVYDFGSISERQAGRVYFSENEQYADMGEYLESVPSRTDVYMLAKSARSPSGNVLTFQYQRFGSAIPLWVMPASYAPYKATPKFISGTNPKAIESSSLLLSAITSSDGRRVDFVYSKDTGRLESMRSNNRAWTYSYLTPDAINSRSLSKVVLPDGSAWSYAYAPGAYLTVLATNTNRVTIPLNTNAITSRKLVGITYPSGGTSKYEYGFSNLKTRINYVDYYVSAERIVRKTLSTGHQWNYTYTRGSSGKHDSTRIIGPNGTVNYKFFGPSFGSKDNLWRVGRIAEVVYPGGNSEVFSWMPRVLVNISTEVEELGKFKDSKVWVADLSKKTVARDGATYITQLASYDVYGNPGVRMEVGPNGGSRTTKLSYFNDPNKWIIGHLKSETSPGVSMNRTFDANGKVLTETRDGVTTKFTYDTLGNVASKTTPGGGVYTYSNYKRGIAQTETRPEGVMLTRVVDDAGNIISETNGEGKTKTYTYDSLNRRTSFTPPVGNRQTIAYTPTTKTATRGALVEKTVYGPFGRPASVTLAGITRTFTYDGLGRKTFESDPGVATGMRYQYDALDRLIRLTNADGTFQSRSYGPANMSVVDERGKTTTYTYRAYGDPDKQLLVAITAPEASANVSMELSPNGLMTAVSQGGRKRTYGYDAHNYLISVTNPETGITTYGRDIAGNMTSKKVGASGITKYSYDGLNRLKSTIYPGTTPAVVNTYNKDSRLLTSHTSGGNRSFAYDAAGNLTQESLALDGKVFTAKYAYNGNDQLSSITYPQSGRVVSYTPDALGRPTTVSGYVKNVKYWPSGLIQSITYSNGTVSTYGQNARLWPSSFLTQKTATADVYLSSNYTYDGVGNLATIKDAVDSNFNRTLGYDNINRLTSAVGFWGQGSITYDGGGNLTKQTLGQSSLAYTYDTNNRLSKVSGLRASTFGYDAYGNVSSSQGNTYSYNDVPNLTCINCANPTVKVEYSYDGLNHRSAVTKSNGKVYEMHDSNGKPLIELDAGTLTEYLYLGDKRIAQRVSP